MLIASFSTYDWLERRGHVTAKARGYSTPSAFLRAAIADELSDRSQQPGIEERVVASFNRAFREISRLNRAQEAIFALLDTLTKTLLTCVPGAPPEAKLQAVARAKERYETLMKNAGKSIIGDARAALLDLMCNGEHEETV